MVQDGAKYFFLCALLVQVKTLDIIHRTHIRWLWKLGRSWPARDLKTWGERHDCEFPRFSFCLTYPRNGQHYLHCTRGTDTQSRNVELHILAIDPAFVDSLVTCFFTFPPVSSSIKRPCPVQFKPFLTVSLKTNESEFVWFCFYFWFSFHFPHEGEQHVSHNNFDPSKYCLQLLFQAQPKRGLPLLSQ